MNRLMNQTLNFVTQDTIATLNEMVGEGYFLGYLDTLERIENIILSDEGGSFADENGEPRPGIFRLLKSLHALKDDIHTLNALCPDSPAEVSGADY
ncbi:MAG: hypothetical protein PUK67_03605 [Prevotellaceae bacterium]|nr:hypothetical protein [Prevotellaceae bacterium]MDY3365122.1 hypothetical protein [Prevotella sp.]